MLFADFMTLSSTELVLLLPIAIYIAEIGNFAFVCCSDLEPDPMTFMYELDH